MTSRRRCSMATCSGVCREGRVTSSARSSVCRFGLAPFNRSDFVRSARPLWQATCNAVSPYKNRESMQNL